MMMFWMDCKAHSFCSFKAAGAGKFHDVATLLMCLDCQKFTGISGCPGFPLSAAGGHYIWCSPCFTNVLATIKIRKESNRHQRN